MTKQRWLTSALALALLMTLASMVSAEGPQPQSPTDVNQTVILPFDGTVSTPGTALGVNNTGTGQSAVGVAGRTDQGYAGVVGYSATRYGVFGLSISAAEAGVFGRNDGTGIGVWGKSSSGYGILAESGLKYGLWAKSTNLQAVRAESGNDVGIYSTTGANGRASVYAEHTGTQPGQGLVGIAAVGQGVYAQSNNGVAVAAIGATGDAIDAVTTSTSGAGVYGHNDSGNPGDGVRGLSQGGNGVHGIGVNSNGVKAESTNSNGLEATTSAGDQSAVYAHYEGSNSGNGVYTTASKGNAVYAVSNNGLGVYGKGRNEPGVYAEGRGSDGIQALGSSGGSSGIYAKFDGSQDDGNAGYFEGRVEVTGTLTKGAGSFKIDHPLDPANKYLFHSFVESPDMMNVYNGNIVTDASGEATVAMPDYFEALNRDFRYQLTVIGQFAQAIVGQEISGGKFVIKTDKPNVKVSWQVTGIRHDAYATAHPIVVEEDKPANLKGTYIHPDLFGAPDTQSEGLATRPDLVKRIEASKAEEAKAAQSPAAASQAAPVHTPDTIATPLRPKSAD